MKESANLSTMTEIFDTEMLEDLDGHLSGKTCIEERYFIDIILKHKSRSIKFD